MSKLVIIDGNAILHRAYHAIPPLTSKSGEPINAVYGFISMLLRIISDLQPSHLAVAFDRKEPTFRQKSFAAYQAQRPVMHADLSSQFETVKEILAAGKISVYSQAGYEADDVIGSLASLATKKQIDEITIVTGDRDILQLVTDKVKVYLPIKGLSEAQLLGTAEVSQKMGVKPSLIPDYKALVGDPSDNYPGVPGIGPKTATELLNKYHSVDAIYQDLKFITQPVRLKLEKGKDLAVISHKLATIVTTIPLKIDFAELKKWQIYNPEVEKIFDRIGFKTLKSRMVKAAREISVNRSKEKQDSLF